jgi:hypothetical protein
MDAHEHAYRVMAIMERHRMELGGFATDGGPGCAPAHPPAEPPAAPRPWAGDPRRPAVAPPAARC